MASGNSKVVVEVKEREDKALEHAGPDGKVRTYYPGRQMWLDLQDLQVGRQINEAADRETLPTLSTYVHGLARLEDRDLSIIGDPENKTRTVQVSFVAGDISAAVRDALRESNEVLGIIFSDEPLGGARLDFARSHSEIGNPDEWRLFCHVPEPCLLALRDGVANGQLNGVKLGLTLRNLYTTEHPMAPPSARAHLFLRPREVDSTIDWPEPATGAITHLNMQLAKVDMRPIAEAKTMTARSIWKSEQCCPTPWRFP